MEAETLQSAPTPITDEDENLSDAPMDPTTISDDPITLTTTSAAQFTPSPLQPPSKKPKKKTPNSVWTKPTSRKKPKKNPNNNNSTAAAAANTSTSGRNTPTPATSLPRGPTVHLTPIPRFPDSHKHDDNPLIPILLSRAHKAEKIDLSDDRLTASSSKGYRMVRATRGVFSNSYYFEINILHLGPTGHVRLGWVMEKADLQAPVGYDGYGFGYRDVDGSKVHKGLREGYGEEFGEGDVVGFYVSLPGGDGYFDKMPGLVWYKGQRYICNAGDVGKDDGPKVVPGSEISFFKNGVCQGVAYKDLVGGRYYPAASMYTLPNQPNCEVRFNFGPNFECFPRDFGNRPIPRPMSDVPYHGYDVKAEEPPMENGFH